MTQQIVNNGDTGLDARNKINENFTELYDAINNDRLILDKSNVPISVTGSTSETLLYTFAIPAGVFLANSVLDIRYMVAHSSGGGTITPRLKINGITVQSVAHSTTQVSAEGLFRIQNRNSLSSQIANPSNALNPFSLSTTAFPTYSFDTSNVIMIAFTLQLSNGANTGRLEGIVLSLIK